MSYVFFEDGPDLSGDPTAYNGQWFYATSEGEAAMQHLLTQLGVRSQPEAAAAATAIAPPVVAPPVAATAPARAPLPAMLLAALAGSLVIVWLARWNVKQPIPSETPAK